MKMGGVHRLTDAYLALEMGMIGSIVSVFGMQAAMRLRSEELAWRADLVLATATRRRAWVASHVLLAVLGTAGIILVGGLASGIGYAAAASDPTEVGRMLAAAAVQIPAACVLVGIVVAVFGLVPGWTTATWGALVGFLLVGEFGTVFNLPRWVMDLSPFGHVPRLPGGALDAAPLVWLSVVAAALVAVGFSAFGMRDVGRG